MVATPGIAPSLTCNRDGYWLARLPVVALTEGSVSACFSSSTVASNAGGDTNDGHQGVDVVEMSQKCVKRGENG